MLSRQISSLEATARHSHVVCRRFFVFQQDIEHATPLLSSTERSVVVYKRLYQHKFWQFWAHLSLQLITLLNKPYFSLLCANSVVSWLQTRGQSNLTKSASRGAHSPVRGHPRGGGRKLYHWIPLISVVVCRAVLPSTASPGGGWGSGL